MARITAAETALRVSVVSWRDHLAQDRGRGRPGFSGYAEPAQVVDDTVSVSRCAARGEDSVGPDECEAAAGIAIDHVDEPGVAPDAGRLECTADAGAGHDQHVASAAELVMQPGRSVLATDVDVGEPISGLRPAAVTVGLDQRAPRVGD
jgi:hypothetical protein